MRDILFKYELNPTTWAYLSALLTIGITSSSVAFGASATWT